MTGGVLHGFHHDKTKAPLHHSLPLFSFLLHSPSLPSCKSRSGALSAHRLPHDCCGNRSGRAESAPRWGPGSPPGPASALGLDSTPDPSRAAGRGPGQGQGLTGKVPRGEGRVRGRGLGAEDEGRSHRQGSESGMEGWVKGTRVGGRRLRSEQGSESGSEGQGRRRGPESPARVETRQGAGGTGR